MVYVFLTLIYFADTAEKPVRSVHLDGPQGIDSLLLFVLFSAETNKSSRKCTSILKAKPLIISTRY